MYKPVFLVHFIFWNFYYNEELGTNALDEIGNTKTYKKLCPNMYSGNMQVSCIRKFAVSFLASFALTR